MIKLEIQNKLAIVQLNRPKKKNALSTVLLAELQDVFVRLQQDAQISVILIKGDTDFSSGGDIKEMLVEDRKAAEILIKKVQAAFDTIYQTDKIVVAYTQGLVFGGGLELSLVSDIVISHANAQFSMPEAALGIVPGAGGTQYLPRVIGYKNAAYMLLSGDVFSAEQMKEMGLVQQINDDFFEVRDWLDKISKKNINTLKTIKSLLRTEQVDLKKEATSFVDLLMEDGRDLIAEFLTKKVN